MNKEEIEELKDFTIDLTDIDELALGLEVCSKKSNMVIQEFADTIIQLQQENKKQKEVIDKIEKYIEKQARMYGLSMPIELGTHLDNILGILKEVSE